MSRLPGAPLGGARSGRRHNVLMPPIQDPPLRRGGGIPDPPPLRRADGDLPDPTLGNGDDDILDPAPRYGDGDVPDPPLRRDTGTTGPPAPWQAPAATGPVRATVALPGSKSMTARALVLAALADGPSTLRGPLRARDTELMAGGLRALGTDVSTEDDQVWRVRPGSLRGPAEIQVGLAGTVMRFLPPVAGLAEGTVRFDGDPRARDRPLRPLLAALGQAGVEVAAAESGGLPVTVSGTGSVTGGPVALDASASSQLVSGLLLAAPRFTRGVEIGRAHV